MAKKKQVKIIAITDIISIRSDGGRLELKPGQTAWVEKEFADSLIAQYLAQPVDADKSREESLEAAEEEVGEEATGEEESTEEDEEDEEEPPPPPKKSTRKRTKRLSRK